MASKDDVKHLILTGVRVSDRVVGRGGFGIVIEVDHNGVTCAAKQVHSQIVEFASPADLKHLKQGFLSECLLHSKLDHPNIVKMLGVYYPSEEDFLPVLVMELMEYNLATFLGKFQDIPMYVKLSILQDVSRGVHYLHTLNTPVMHRDLNSNNILLNNNLVVKLCDFAVEKMSVSPYSSDGMTQVPGTAAFMPPEALLQDPHYGLPLDVFSFGCIVCHVISQQWPTPSPSVYKDPKTGKLFAATEAKRRQHYIDQISDVSLKQLVISCLDGYQEGRPPISQVCGRITSIITGELTCLYCTSILKINHAGVGISHRVML